jgi:hypothetical protein
MGRVFESRLGYTYVHTYVHRVFSEKKESTSFLLKFWYKDSTKFRRRNSQKNSDHNFLSPYAHM